MTVEEVLSRLEGVRRVGNEWAARCPAHKDGDPSLSIGEGQNGGVVIHCHAGCTPGAVVGAIGLELHNLMPPNGGSSEGKATTQPPTTTPSEATAFWNGLSKQDSLSIEYLVGRKLQPLPEGLVRFDTADPLYRVALPLYDSTGQIVNVERRAIAETKIRMMCLGGAPKKGTAFGRLAGDGPVWIVEGLTDFLAASILAERLGVCPLGAPGSENAAPLVEACAKQLRGRRVYVSMDSDKAGQKAETEACRALAAAGAEALPARYPAGFNDLAELVEKRGAEAAAEIMQEAIDGAIPPTDAANDADSARNDGQDGFSTTLDELPRPSPAGRTWPEIQEEALHGLAGDVVREIDPHTEADPAAILIHFLAFFGSAVGPSPHFRVGADVHRANLFAAIVGSTSKGRKGTAEGQVRRLFDQALPDWSGKRIFHGLSSGEGLIATMRDAGPGADASPGSTSRDVRLMVIEPEFASTLRVMRRDSNTLSAVLRQAWDGRDLRVMTRRDPLVATGAHVSILAHITQAELLASLEAAETSNGFANRFLWTLARRSKLLPEGGALTDAELQPLYKRLDEALDTGHRRTELRRSEASRALWRGLYEELSQDRPGLLGMVTSRAEAQVSRLSLIYALLDSSGEIGTEHLQAAMAVWTYASRSATMIFGDRVGDPVADRILRLLRAETPRWISRSGISEELGRNFSGQATEAALSLLGHLGLAETRMVRSGEKGRPPEEWRASR